MFLGVFENAQPELIRRPKHTMERYAHRSTRIRRNTAVSFLGMRDDSIDDNIHICALIHPVVRTELVLLQPFFDELTRKRAIPQDKRVILNSKSLIMDLLNIQLMLSLSLRSIRALLCDFDHCLDRHVLIVKDRIEIQPHKELMLFWTDVGEKILQTQGLQPPWYPRTCREGRIEIFRITIGT